MTTLHAQVEGAGPPGRRDSWRDVAAGLGGAAMMAADLLTPFLRPLRSRWGVSRELAARVHPGDDRVPEVNWQWTHGITIDAPAAAVWPWVAQIGVDRGAFYSYQWLENLVGCDLRNADSIHAEWEHHLGSALILHSRMPPLPVVAIERGRLLLVHAAADAAAQAAGRPWVSVSWLFLVEPLDEGRCRLVSRFRSAHSGDLATRLAAGVWLTESIGFPMDRRMLLGIKARAERAWAGPSAPASA